MDSPDYIISISSEDEEQDDDIEIVEFRKQTQQLLDNPAQPASSAPAQAKRFADIQCPICFDEISKATTTSCGHVFCLECISQSISSSHARGQVRGRRGIGLCPLCRKQVAFKDTIVLRMKKQSVAKKPQLPARECEHELKIATKVDAENPRESGSEEEAPRAKKQKHQ